MILGIICLNPYSNGILTDIDTVSGVIMESDVLILILMEYSQTAATFVSVNGASVLILILMEYSQTSTLNRLKIRQNCLNPYSNGILTDKFCETIMKTKDVS